jgi:hypothetical protein
MIAADPSRDFAELAPLCDNGLTGPRCSCTSRGDPLRPPIAHRIVPVSFWLALA